MEDIIKCMWQHEKAERKEKQPTQNKGHRANKNQPWKQ